MSLIDFWNTIHESGQLHVDPPAGAGAKPNGREEKTLRDAIVQVEAQWRLELAFDPPALILPVADWAVTTMYAACQCLVYREIDPDMVSAALAVECPLPPPAHSPAQSAALYAGLYAGLSAGLSAALSPDVCYSADLNTQTEGPSPFLALAHEKRPS